MHIEIQNLEMTYPNGKRALDGVSLSLRSPSLVGLLGPNGAGKSTLMKLLVAALLPTKGAVFVNGSPMPGAERALKAQLGYLPQDFGLFDELTATQFLSYMAALKGLKDSRAAVQEAIAAVGLEEKARARIRTLSGGQRQRVGIAQALLGDAPSAWTPRSASASATSFPAWRATGWYCSPRTSSTTCSPCATT